MDGSEGFEERDNLLAGGATSSSELLFSNDAGDGDIVGLGEGHNPFYHHSSSTLKPPKMLCFGGYRHQSNEGDIVLVSDATKTNTQKSTITCSDSSSASSGNNKNNVTVITTFNNKCNRVTVSKPNVTVITSSIPPAGQRRSKKIKSENPTSAFQVKIRKKIFGCMHAVRREKLGDRITALQQLVSPFGKTDTASVLHGAMGYIRFLQDQVQVLCSPYLQHLPDGGVNGGGEESGKDLRSRGLCLVPAVHVANSNGADYWSPATMGNSSNFTSASSAKH